MLVKSGVDVTVTLPSDREVAFTCTFERVISCSKHGRKPSTCDIGGAARDQP
jgi:hypothetical protein